MKLQESGLPSMPTLLQERLSKQGGPGSLRDPRAWRLGLEMLAREEPAWSRFLDPLLLQAREAETAADGLPTRIGDLRRIELLLCDAISSTWRARDLRTGDSFLVRCLRPSLREDAVWTRRLRLGTRLSKGLGGLLPVTTDRSADWPHLRVRLDGVPLSELMVAGEPLDGLAFTRVLVGALGALRSLHARGLVHGHVGPPFLLLGREAPCLAWLDPFPRGLMDPREDLTALARTLLGLGRGTLAPTDEMLESWVEAPPGIEDAIRLARAALAEGLLASRHALHRAGRVQGHRIALARLLARVRRLSRALPPPAVSACLVARSDGSHTFVRCQGYRIDVSPAELAPDRRPSSMGSIDGPLPRALAGVLLRAWAGRRPAPEEPPELALLMRWVRAWRRLDTIRLLLESALRAEGNLGPS